MSNDILSHLADKTTQDEIKNSITDIKSDISNVNTNMDTVKTDLSSIKSVLNESSQSNDVHDSLFCNVVASDNILKTVVTSEETSNNVLTYYVNINKLKGTLRLTASIKIYDSKAETETRVSIEGSDGSNTTTLATGNKHPESTSYVTDVIDFNVDYKYTQLIITITRKYSDDTVYCNLLTLSGTLSPANDRVY